MFEPRRFYKLQSTFFKAFVMVDGEIQWDTQEEAKAARQRSMPVWDRENIKILIYKLVLIGEADEQG